VVAAWWYEFSAALGYGKARIGLARLHALGEGIQRDGLEAFKQLNKADYNNDDTDASIDLAMIYSGRQQGWLTRVVAPDGPSMVKAKKYARAALDGLREGHDTCGRYQRDMEALLPQNARSRGSWKPVATVRHGSIETDCLLFTTSHPAKDAESAWEEFNAVAHGDNLSLWSYTIAFTSRGPAAVIRETTTTAYISLMTALTNGGSDFNRELAEIFRILTSP
jgi:hypothetical protein